MIMFLLDVRESLPGQLEKKTEKMPTMPTNFFFDKIDIITSSYVTMNSDYRSVLVDVQG